MARNAVWVVLVAVGFVFAGCGPVKELPTDIPNPDEVIDKKIDVPAASEKAAKEYVEKAIKSFTGGKPELVAKGIASRIVLKGKMFTRDGAVADTTRTIAAVWPDRLTDTDNQTIQGSVRPPLTAYLHRPQWTVLNGGVEMVDVSSWAERGRNFASDQTAHHWMGLMVPLAEPKAVVFDLQSTALFLTPNGQPQDVKRVKFALPQYPVYQLTFDAKTDLLVRVEHTVSEIGVRMRKQWTVLEHKPGADGRLLPHKIDYRINGAPAEEWEVEKWDFPAKIEDSEFSPPLPKK